MKKLLVLSFILMTVVGCSYDNDINVNREYAFDYTDSAQINKLRHLYLDNMSPFRFAVIKENILNNTVELKNYYKFEYNGGEIENADFSHNTDSIGQLIECVENENVKEDMIRVYSLLKYADENNSQNAFDTAYEILETLNAYLFNYPLTQSVFSGWELYVNAADINIFYPVTRSFGCDYDADEINYIVKNVDLPKTSELREKIISKEKDIDRRIKAVTNKRAFECMHSVKMSAEKLKFAADNYDQDNVNAYCTNVKAAMAELNIENDKLLTFLKAGDIRQEYIELSESIDFFDNSYKDSFTRLDILSVINEIYYKAIKSEYLYCNSGDNNRLNENITLGGITRELES